MALISTYWGPAFDARAHAAASKRAATAAAIARYVTTL